MMSYDQLGVNWLIIYAPSVADAETSDAAARACLVHYVHTYRMAQKSKPLPNDQKIVLYRIKACQ